MAAEFDSVSRNVIRTCSHSPFAGLETTLRQAAVEMCERFAAGQKLLLCGNGGCAAIAQHFAAECVGKFERPGRRPLPAIALSSDAAVVTAIANDFGFDRVFARQISALGRKGDLLMALSTSGVSEDILRAVEMASQQGLCTISISRKGSTLGEMAQIPIALEASNAREIQELQTAILHTFAEILDRCFDNQPTIMSTPDIVSKITTAENLGQHRWAWSNTGLVVVWVNGGFDLLHAGHIALLQKARRCGDVLIVGVDTDESIRETKLDEPIFPLEDRIAMLCALEGVGYVVPLAARTAVEVIQRIRPDVYCSGAEHRDLSSGATPEKAAVEKYGGRIEYIEMVGGYSTCSIIGRLRQHGQLRMRSAS